MCKYSKGCFSLTELQAKHFFEGASCCFTSVCFAKLLVSTMKMNCSRPSTCLPKAFEMLQKKINISFCECYEGCAIFLPLHALLQALVSHTGEHPSQSWPDCGPKNLLPKCTACTEASSGFGEVTGRRQWEDLRHIKCFSEINIYFDEKNHVASLIGIFCLNESRSPGIGLPNSVMSHWSIFTMPYQILHKCNKITWKRKCFFFLISIDV